VARCPEPSRADGRRGRPLRRAPHHVAPILPLRSASPTGAIPSADPVLLASNATGVSTNSRPRSGGVHAPAPPVCGVARSASGGTPSGRGREFERWLAENRGGTRDRTSRRTSKRPLIRALAP
jgi:hypothetical protein